MVGVRYKDASSCVRLAPHLKMAVLKVTFSEGVDVSGLTKMLVAFQLRRAAICQLVRGPGMRGVREEL